MFHSYFKSVLYGKLESESKNVDSSVHLNVTEIEADQNQVRFFFLLYKHLRQGRNFSDENPNCDFSIKCELKDFL